MKVESLFDKIRKVFPSIKNSKEVITPGETMLNSNFASVVTFVECVVSQLYTMKSDPTYKNREKGLKGLEWLKSQKAKDVKYQSALDEIKILYTWWTELRPKRGDPWQGISRSFSDFKDEWLNTKEDSNIEYKSFMDKGRHAEKLQEIYKLEDTKMLVRLIKIREYL